jgi:hypothetical protein
MERYGTRLFDAGSEEADKHTLSRTNEVNIGVSGFKMDENDGFDNWLWAGCGDLPLGTLGLNRCGRPTEC